MIRKKEEEKLKRKFLPLLRGKMRERWQSHLNLFLFLFHPKLDRKRGERPKG